ncbi:SRPBCC domain-containing protein [Mycobacterium sp. NPDC050853]|uniref:SRPBCC family protein n=1 Tax=Mycobacteriaceae TaxID=1762 RepID=UPI0015DF919A|nr:SRPBCC domain-containing protein [Mycobacteroides sp. LB1]
MSSGDPTSITFSEFYPYPIETVWDVLVSLELTASQVNEVSDTPVEVGQTRVIVTHPQPTVGFDGVVRTTYTSVVPNEHIEQVVTAPGIEVTSRWNLLPEPGGTRLRVTYSRFDPTIPLHRQWRTMLFSGAGPILTSLREMLDKRH